MLGVVRVKPGVQFTTIAPGGFRMLCVLDMVALAGGFDITITSACDGEHSGPDDPHHRGEAYDIRTHDLADKNKVLEAIKDGLGMDRFFAWIEDENEPNEHIHLQVKKGTVYP
jgi:hypothetical protein